MQGNYGGAPSIPQAERRESLAAPCEILQYLVDFIRFPSLDKPGLIAAVDAGGGFAELDGVLAKGNGAIIVCVHFGNWDLGAGATAARGYPLTVVAETFSDVRLDAMVSGARSNLGMKIVKMEKAGPSLLRSLKQNGLVALLIDRSVPGEGVTAKFFGAEVEVPAGPARLALRTGATVIPTAFPRIDPRRPEILALCDFTIPTDKTGDDEADIRRITQAIMHSHERFIRQYPDQWYMFRPMWSKRAAVLS